MLYVPSVRAPSLINNVLSSSKRKIVRLIRSPGFFSSRRRLKKSRSEERRVGKECRSRGGAEQESVDAAGASGRSVFFFFQAEDGIRDYKVTGVQTCALPISLRSDSAAARCCTFLPCERRV